MLQDLSKAIEEGLKALRNRDVIRLEVAAGTNSNLIDAIRQPGQFDLVEAVVSARRPTIAVALRTPWDVARYPASAAAMCTYSILPDSLEALAAGLAGAIPFAGRLAVAVPGFGSPAGPAGPASPALPGSPT